MGSPPSVGKTSSVATYFYIGDGGAKSPVVLHCFHAKKGQREVPLKPALVFAEACLGLIQRAGQRVITVTSPLPETHFFGELPGAFVENRPASSRALWSLLRAQRCAEASNSQEMAWACRAEAVLGPFTFLALWGFGPCYRQHSRRAILQGTCLAAWPVALLHCWRLRQRARRAASRAGGARAALREGQEALRRFLDEWQSFRSREENTEGISLDELTTLAFVRCLAAIPEALLPIEWELQLRVRQLAEALQGRLRKAWCNVDEDAAVLRWTEASEEPGAAVPSKAEGGATTHVHGRNPISGIVHFLQDFLKEWPSPKDEDAASSQPLSTTQKRGNLIFAAWLLGR